MSTWRAFYHAFVLIAVESSRAREPVSTHSQRLIWFGIRFEQFSKLSCCNNSLSNYINIYVNLNFLDKLSMRLLNDSWRTILKVCSGGNELRGVNALCRARKGAKDKRHIARYWIAWHHANWKHCFIFAMQSMWRSRSRQLTKRILYRSITHLIN